MLDNNSTDTPNAWMRLLPNCLTVARIAIIPVIVLTFYFDDSVFAHRLGSSLFALACLTDFVDGYLARQFNALSSFGKMFDPIADKILVGCVIVMLVHKDKVDPMPCLLILAREFLVAGLREFLAEIRVSIPVSRLAKVKTFLQMLALTVLILGSKGSGIKQVDYIGYLLIWGAAVLTMFTGFSYLKECIKHV